MSVEGTDNREGSAHSWKGPVGPRQCLADFPDLDGQPSRHQRHHEELEGSADDPARRSRVQRQQGLRKVHPAPWRHLCQQAHGQNSAEEGSSYVCQHCLVYAMGSPLGT